MLHSSDAAPSADALKVMAVIPARLHSTRLPRKVLREIAGKPLLAWTYEAALACERFEQIIVAVDSEEVAQLCQSRGWAWQMTSPTLPSGTDRLAKVAETSYADVYVNMQGDEPLLTRTHIDALLRPFRNANVDVSTLRTQCLPHEINDPNAVKVVTAKDDRALYFSRASIPYERDGTGSLPKWKHLGIYAYRRGPLLQFAALPQSPLEQTEKLEQLRLLENGLSLYVPPVDQPTVGVDTEDDLQHVQKILLERTLRTGKSA